MNISDCRLIEIIKIGDRDGSLSIMENSLAVPFDTKRVFYIYDIPGGESRGAHAHKCCQQFIIAASGSFSVKVDDGLNSTIFHLNRPHYGLYIPPMIWASEFDFSGGSVCLVLTSELFDEADYIRDYDTFINFRGETSNQ